MGFLLALILIIWMMFYSVGRFFQYFKIVSNYKDSTTAKIISVKSHERKKKREKKAVDVVIEYMINGKDGRSEFTVPLDVADHYTLGKEVKICYFVAGNGAVHVAADNPMTKKLMTYYAISIAIEFIAFVVIWYIGL